MDILIAVLLFVGVIAVTALIFGGWAIYGIVRAIVNGVSSLFLPAPQPSRLPGLAHGAAKSRCPRARCRAENPAGARFCRRCGASLADYGASMPASAAVPQRRRVFASSETARPAGRIAL